MLRTCLLVAALTFGVLSEQRVVLEFNEDGSSDITVPDFYAPTTVDFDVNEHVLRLIVAVKQRNTDQLEDIFWRVSDPTSPEYGKHLTIDEITALVAPAQETVDAVLAWLRSSGAQVLSVDRNRDFIHISMTVASASDMLNVEFGPFRHLETGKVLVRSAQPYTVPFSVSEHIDFIAGVNGFNVPHRAKSPAPDTLQVGPADLRKRYNVTAVGKSSKNKQAVAEFQGQYYSPSDLSQFFKEYVHDSTEDKVAKVVGQNDGSAPGVEASLDIQYIMGVAPDVETWFYSQPSFDFWSDLTAWVSQINQEDDAPFVHSVSYGSQGNYPSKQYRDRLDTEFQKLGARGISVIFASGDSGTGCFLCGEYLPSFPATSIYVTSVGATTFENNAVGPEEAVTAFHSGGGMSLLFEQPSYQKDAVQGYLSSGVSLPESFYYSKTGRGTPDVAALGWGFSVVVGGSVESVGGTSAAAPTFSAVITLLNDLKLQNGNSTLGFLNPWLYQTQKAHPSAFYDVTVGNNQHGCCGVQGFLCYKGWDPVTGLGTPNYAELSKLV